MRLGLTRPGPAGQLPQLVGGGIEIAERPVHRRPAILTPGIRIGAQAGQASDGAQADSAGRQMQRGHAVIVLRIRIGWAVWPSVAASPAERRSWLLLPGCTGLPLRWEGKLVEPL